MIGLIGKKLGHTRVYDADGNGVPVTCLLYTSPSPRDS